MTDEITQDAEGTPDDIGEVDVLGELGFTDIESVEQDVDLTVETPDVPESTDSTPDAEVPAEEVFETEEKQELESEPAEEPVVEEEVTSPAEGTEEEVLAEIEEPTEAAQAEVEPSPVIPESDSNVVIEQLRGQIEQLSAVVAQNQAQTQAQNQTQQPEFQHLQFVKDDEHLSNLLSDPNSLNTVLNQIYESAVSKTREFYLTEVPTLVQAPIQQQLEMQEIRQDFYKRNPDLTGIKQFVGTVANEIASASPELNFAQVVEKTEGEVRTRLKMAAPTAEAATPNASAKKTTTQRSTRSKRPAFAGAKGSRQPAQAELTELEKDLNDVLGL